MKTNLKSAMLSFFAVVAGIVVGGMLGVLAGGIAGGIAGVGLLWLMIATGPQWNGDAATGLGGLIILTAFLGAIVGACLDAARSLR